MEVRFWINCFDRELVIKFPFGYEHLKEEIKQMLDDYYFEWHDVENIGDPEERKYVQDSCLEEYMMERLRETYNMWDEWNSIYRGDDLNEIEDEVYWNVNPLKGEIINEQN